MNIYALDDLSAARRQEGKRYHEFLRVPSMSAGVYELAAGGADPQQPHSEDELYYVVRGRARVQVGAEDMAVEAGTLIFVAAHVEHRFYEIAEDLTVLVF